MGRGAVARRVFIPFSRTFSNLIVSLSLAYFFARSLLNVRGIVCGAFESLFLILPSPLSYPSTLRCYSIKTEDYRAFIVFPAAQRGRFQRVYVYTIHRPSYNWENWKELSKRIETLSAHSKYFWNITDCSIESLSLLLWWFLLCLRTSLANILRYIPQTFSFLALIECAFEAPRWRAALFYVTVYLLSQEFRWFVFGFERRRSSYW